MYFVSLSLSVPFLFRFNLKEVRTFTVHFSKKTDYLQYEFETVSEELI